MKKIKFIIIIPFIAILAVWAAYICFDRDVESSKTLDLDTVEIDNDYTLVKFSEIQSWLYKNLSQKQINKINDSDDYNQDKSEGEQGTTLNGVGICIVDGRITKYASNNKYIVVYERDSRQYYSVRKTDGKIIFTSKKQKEMEKKTGLDKNMWKKVTGIKGA